MVSEIQFALRNSYVFQEDFKLSRGNEDFLVRYKYILSIAFDFATGRVRWKKMYKGEQLIKEGFSPCWFINSCSLTLVALLTVFNGALTLYCFSF